jgi:hypothetical protein
MAADSGPDQPSWANRAGVSIQPSSAGTTSPSTIEKMVCCGAHRAGSQGICCLSQV